MRALVSKWSPTALAYSAEGALAPKAGQPWPSLNFGITRRSVPSFAKATEGYLPRTHPRVDTRGFLRRRVNHRRFSRLPHLVSFIEGKR